MLQNSYIAIKKSYAIMPVGKNEIMVQLWAQSEPPDIAVPGGDAYY